MMAGGGASALVLAAFLQHTLAAHQHVRSLRAVQPFLSH